MGRFSDDYAYEEYRKKVAPLIDREYNKRCLHSIPDGWDSKMMEAYNRIIRKIIEEDIMNA